MANDTMAIHRAWTWVIPAREEDWDALYAEQLPRIYNFFRFRVGEGAVAEDLTSITFEKAWRAAPVPAGPRGVHHLARHHRPQRRGGSLPAAAEARDARGG